VDERQQEMRGEDARRILDAPLYKEAYVAVEQRIVSELRLRDTPKERKDYLITVLVGLTEARKYLEQVLTTGTIAAMEIERKRTLRERVVEPLRKFGGDWRF